MDPSRRRFLRSGVTVGGVLAGVLGRTGSGSAVARTGGGAATGAPVGGVCTRARSSSSRRVGRASIGHSRHTVGPVRLIDCAPADDDS